MNELRQTKFIIVKQWQNLIKSMFFDGVYHGDMHQGNIFFILDKKEEKVEEEKEVKEVKEEEKVEEKEVKDFTKYKLVLVFWYCW